MRGYDHAAAVFNCLNATYLSTATPSTPLLLAALNAAAAGRRLASIRLSTYYHVLAVVYMYCTVFL
jgi:hypothetical protein